jgi:biotin transporter BioY
VITLNISPIEAVGIGVYPFIIGDLIKASLAIGIAQKLK